jgi:hypothetical protein
MLNHCCYQACCLVLSRHKYVKINSAVMASDGPWTSIFMSVTVISAVKIRDSSLEQEVLQRRSPEPAFSCCPTDLSCDYQGLQFGTRGPSVTGPEPAISCLSWSPLWWPGTRDWSKRSFSDRPWTSIFMSVTLISAVKIRDSRWARGPSVTGPEPAFSWLLYWYHHLWWL